MEDRLETRWTHEDTIKSYNPFREMFREASADAVRKVFGQYVDSRDRIIEVGSGLGELVNLAPDYRTQIQQTEQNPKIAQGNRTLNPDSNIMVANIYDQPFPNGAFDVAVGYSVFDTLANLEDALIEVERVLDKDGCFIHFLDLTACANTLFHKYSKTDKAIFPLIELDEKLNKYANTGIQIVEPEDLPTVRKSFDPRLSAFFDMYVKNPELMFTVASDPKYRGVLLMVSDYVTKSGVTTIPIRFNDELRNDMERSLNNAGYVIIESGNRDGTAIIQRNGRHLQYPQYNLFHNDVGLDRSKFDPTIAHELDTNQVKIISTLYVTVADKAEP